MAKKATAKRKKELAAIIYKARKELWEIEGEEADERNEAIVGRHYKYRNCYSCPETPADYWWVYYKVLRTEDGGIVCLTFDTDKYGKCTMRDNEHRGGLLDGCQPITPDEFVGALGEFVGRVHKMEIIGLGSLKIS